MPIRMGHLPESLYPAVTPTVSLLRLQDLPGGIRYVGFAGNRACEIEISRR